MWHVQVSDVQLALTHCMYWKGLSRTNGIETVNNIKQWTYGWGLPKLRETAKDRNHWRLAQYRDSHLAPINEWIRLHLHKKHFRLWPIYCNCSSRIVFSRIPIEVGPTRNSAIRSAEPENPAVDPNMKSVGWPLAEIWPFDFFSNWDVGRSVGRQYILLLTLILYTVSGKKGIQ